MKSSPSEPLGILEGEALGAGNETPPPYDRGWVSLEWASSLRREATTLRFGINQQLALSRLTRSAKAGGLRFGIHQQPR